jgi:hypothetical protein
LGAFGTSLTWRADVELRDTRPIPDDPPFDFNAAFQQYRLSGVVDIVTSGGALAAAWGIYLNRRWGRVALASVIGAHTVFQFGYRFLPGPRYVPVSGAHLLWLTVLSMIAWWWASRRDPQSAQEA